MAEITLPKAAIVGALAESILYGMLSVMFFAAFRDLTQRRRTANLSKVLLYSACALWISATVHVCIVIARSVTAFTDYASAPGGAQAYLARENTALFITMQTIFVIINGITDTLMIYRAWVIWSHNYYIIIPPLCTELAAFISAVISVVHQAMLADNQTFADVPIVVHSADALFAFALATNFTTTALIAGRIVYLMRTGVKTMPGGSQMSRQYISIVGIIVESGALMAATQAVQLGLWAVQQVLIWTFVSILAQIMAISPMLIIVRASANATTPSTPALSGSGVPPKHGQVGSRLALTSKPPQQPIVLTEIVTVGDDLRHRAYEPSDLSTSDDLKANDELKE